MKEKSDNSSSKKPVITIQEIQRILEANHAYVETLADTVSHSSPQEMTELYLQLSVPPQRLLKDPRLSKLPDFFMESVCNKQRSGQNKYIFILKKKLRQGWKETLDNQGILYKKLLKLSQKQNLPLLRKELKKYLRALESREQELINDIYMPILSKRFNHLKIKFLGFDLILLHCKFHIQLSGHNSDYFSISCIIGIVDTIELINNWHKQPLIESIRKKLTALYIDLEKNKESTHQKRSNQLISFVEDKLQEMGDHITDAIFRRKYFNEGDHLKSATELERDELYVKTIDETLIATYQNDPTVTTKQSNSKKSDWQSQCESYHMLFSKIHSKLLALEKELKLNTLENSINRPIKKENLIEVKHTREESKTESPEIKNSKFERICHNFKNHRKDFEAIFTKAPHQKIKFNQLLEFVTLAEGEIIRSSGSRHRIHIGSIYADILEPSNIKFGAHSPHQSGHNNGAVSSCVVKLFKSGFERAGIAPYILWPETEIPRLKSPLK